MNLYKKYKELNIDTSCLGLIPGSETSEYFCTPLGAKVIGWEGVDGIHYCMIRGFKDMVFSVNPTEGNNQYVHPIASTFKDFLRLLLACGNVSVIEQIYCSDAAEFHELTSKYAITSQQASVLEEINRNFRISPLEQPYEYVKAIQEKFDYTSIRFSKDYYEITENETIPPTEWNVFYGGNFWEHGNSKRAGKEITINKVFTWESETWHIPSIYSCSDGLVIDFCIQINPSSIQTFRDKWPDVMQSDEISDKLAKLMNSENPLSVNADFSIILNGKTIQYKNYCATYWNPCLEDGTTNDYETEMLCEHYGCDKSYGWAFIRASFPWASKGKTQIHSLSICVEQKPKFFPGPHFTTKEKDIEFFHPRTQKKHSLTVLSCSSEQLPPSNFSDNEYEYPCHFQQLNYRIEPELEQSSFMISDCNHGDSPRPLVSNEDEFLPTSHCGVAIIGGARGVTVISSSNKSHSSKRVHTTCSSLYFEAVENVEWQISLHGKTRDDIEIDLI